MRARWKRNLEIFPQKWKIFEKFYFWGPGAEFPYLGIISQYQVFLHNEPISAWECNIYIIYESWGRKSSCDSRYARKLDFRYHAQIWKFGPRPPENYFFQKFLISMERSLNFDSNEPSTTPDIKFKSSYARKLDFSLLCPNMEIQPQAPKNWIFQKNSFFEKVSRFHFQRTLNHPHTLSLSQVMQENVIMPKYGNSGPGSQKWNFSKKIHFFWKGLQISLPTSSQPPPDIKFKLNYVRKRDFVYYAQIWKFGPRLPKMEFFKKVSFFWKGLQISLLTSPQPPAVMPENILSKKLSLGLNFSTPSGGVNSPSPKGSMVWA